MSMSSKPYTTPVNLQDIASRIKCINSRLAEIDCEERTLLREKRELSDWLQKHCPHVEVYSSHAGHLYASWKDNCTLCGKEVDIDYRNPAPYVKSGPNTWVKSSSVDQ